MKKTLIALALLFWIQATWAQIPVKINEYTQHWIQVPDTLSQHVLEEWVEVMENNPVDYEGPLKGIKAFKLVNRDRFFVAGIKDSILEINKRLDAFPYCKRAAILQQLYINNGGKLDNQGRLSVLSEFNINDYSELIFKRQYARRYSMHLITRELKKRPNGNF
jgi:hypothetical protein